MEAPQHEDARKTFFGFSTNIIKTSAPARLDVIGGVGDYSGALVLPMTLAQSTTVYMARNDEQLLRIHDSHAEENGLASEVTIPLGLLFNATADIDYAFARDKIYKHGEASRWAIYVVGCFLVLAKEKNIQLEGADIWIDSDIPFGKGIASSAAIEVAAIQGLAKLLGLQLDEEEVPILAQKVEQEVVGSPCGIMDQLVTYFGEPNTLLPIECQPYSLGKSIPIPKGIEFIGVDSGVKHVIGNGNYPKVRTAIFMGYTIIAKACGVTNHQIKRARTTGQWSKLPFKGYLANISPEEFHGRFKLLLPSQISGKAFIERFGTIIDRHSEIQQEESYSLKSLTEIPININERAKAFRKILEDSPTAIDPVKAAELGAIMYQAHQGFRNLELGNKQTDWLVDELREAGIQNGIFGAKATAGGQGGTVCVLVDGKNSKAVLEKILTKYHNKFGYAPMLFAADTCREPQQHRKVVA